MKRRELLSGLAAAALASGCTSQATRRVQPSQARFGSPVPLPSPATTDTISLEKPSGSAGPCVPSGQIRCRWPPSASCCGPGKGSPAPTASVPLPRPAPCTRWNSMS